MKNKLKRVAAIGTSIAMLGMTMTGALAADLSSYPTGLGFGGADTVMVLGSNADASDSAAAEDIAAGLPGSGHRAAVSSSPRTVRNSIRSEKFEDLPLGTNLSDANDGFGATVDADDLDGLQDTTIDIDIGDKDDDYDVRDEIRLSGSYITASEPLQPHTGLTWSGGSDEFGDTVFIPMMKNSWGYFYVFDDTLQAGNYVNDSSSTEKIEIEFLGKLFQIEGTNNQANQLVVNVGQKFFMSAGDTVVVDGKEVTLLQTGSSTATISVDGQREVIAENDDERVNGLEVRVEDVFSDEGIEFDGATLYIGENARETFDHAEEFVGEDEDSPAWTWVLATLNTNTPVIGIVWSLALDNMGEDDNPLYEHPLLAGESICLPFDYACIEFESLQIDDYQAYEISTNSQENLYFSVANADANTEDITGAKGVEIRAIGANDDGLQCRTSLATGTLVDTKTIYLAVNRSFGSLDVYREQQDGGKLVLCNTVGAASGDYAINALDSAFKIDYRDALIDVDLNWLVPANPSNGSGAEYSEILTLEGVENTLAWNNLSTATGNSYPAYGYIKINPVIGGNNITIYFETDEAKVTTAAYDWADIEYLGDSSGASTTKYDLIYGEVFARFKGGNNSDQLTSSYLGTGAIDVSEYSENTRTQDGLIIVDPESEQSGDRFKFEVPSDLQDFKANIVIRTAGSAGASEVINEAGAQDPATGPAHILDTEVGDLTRYNAIVIGGPAINSAAADLLGLPFPTFGASGNLPFGEGEAIIDLKSNGDKYALVVAGYDAIDTRRAGVVLKNADTFALTGAKKVVTGDNLEVTGITVE